MILSVHIVIEKGKNMLDYTDIIDDVNKVISHSQGFNANAKE